MPSTSSNFSVAFHDYDFVLSHELLSAIPRSVLTSVLQIQDLSAVSRYIQYYVGEFSLGFDGEVMTAAFDDQSGALICDDFSSLVAEQTKLFNPLAIHLSSSTEDDVFCPMPNNISAHFTNNHEELMVTGFEVSLTSLLPLIPPTLKSLMLRGTTLHESVNRQEFLNTIKGISMLNFCFVNWEFSTADIKMLLVDAKDTLTSLSLTNVNSDLDDDTISAICEFNGKLHITFSGELPESTAARFRENNIFFTSHDDNTVYLESPHQQADIW